MRKLHSGSICYTVLYRLLYVPQNSIKLVWNRYYDLFIAANFFVDLFHIHLICCKINVDKANVESRQCNSDCSKDLLTQFELFMALYIKVTIRLSK